MRTRLVIVAALLGAFAALGLSGAASAASRHAAGQLSLAVAPNPIDSGDGVIIYGSLVGAAAGTQITLYHRLAGAPGFTVISKTTTNNFGEFEYTRAEGIVTTNRSWYVVDPAGTQSRTVNELVAALVTLDASTTATTTSQPVVFTGSVSPSHVNALVRVQEQNSISGTGWQTIATGHSDASSNFSISHRFRVPGSYTLRAVFPGDARNIEGDSDSVSVAVQQTESPVFTINTSAPIIPDGQSATISGVLYEVASPATGEGSTAVTLYGKPEGGVFAAIASTTTDTAGNYSFTVTPTNNQIYKVETGTGPRRVTSSLFEGVEDQLTINASSSTAAVGGSVTFTGTVTPDHTGHAIELQMQGPAGGWYGVTGGVVGSGSQYSLSYTFGKAGTFQLRARIDGGPENLGGASSPESVAVSGVVPFNALPNPST